MQSKPSDDLGIIVTIPCYNEPELISSLESLLQCEQPSCSVEIIVVINQGEHAIISIHTQNELTFQNAKSWAQNHSTLKKQFHVIWAKDLPKKHAGVGLARKIAMDEAVKRFEYINNPHGIIACYDADSLCDKNYLTALEKHFRKNPKTPGCAIYYEHPLSGPLPQENYRAIIDYELFLRYYTNALGFAGLPYAYQTVGSSMAVVSEAYQKQGGMNRRHAGEDFYFLHKIIALGNFTELNSTRIIPSARQSDRVPFGTGKAVNDWIKSEELVTYHPNIFKDLKKFVYIITTSNYETERDFVEQFDSYPESIKEFLLENDFKNHIGRILKNSSSHNTFLSNFFGWFNAFFVLKYIHFARDHYYPNIPIVEAARWLGNELGLEQLDNPKDCLEAFRLHDRSVEY